ncbi:MAG: SUMF1/EgtB/PvdO family nonheme iron enzyme, partial [Victivallales bacterium]|nr:SUMF1/EgtB/PvdO family nonheme iron enzyme [Victivallales bacterium]
QKMEVLDGGKAKELAAVVQKSKESKIQELRNRIAECVRKTQFAEAREVARQLEAIDEAKGKTESEAIQKISDKLVGKLLKNASKALRRSQFDDVRTIVSELSAVDAEEARKLEEELTEAEKKEQLSPKKNRKWLWAVLAMVTLVFFIVTWRGHVLKKEAMELSESIQEYYVNEYNQNWTTGQTVGTHKDDFKSNYEDGMNAYAAKDYGAACRHFRKAEKERAWFVENIPLHDKAFSARQTAMAQREKAQIRYGKTYAADLFKKAETSWQKAEHQYEAADFKEAAISFDAAGKAFGEAAEEAEMKQVEYLKASISENIGKKDFVTAESQIKNLEGLGEKYRNTVEELRNRLATARKLASVSEYLTAAKNACQSGNWQEAQHKAEETLKLDPDNAEAKEIKVNALEQRILANINAADFPQAENLIRDLEVLNDQKAQDMRKKLADKRKKATAIVVKQPVLEMPGTQLEYKILMLPGGVELKLVKIKAGSFVMGSPENETGRSNDERRHQVRLTMDYWLGETEVTQAQYAAIMGTNPSASRQGGDYPVENVSWDDAMEFCRKLNQGERAAGRLLPGYEYTLPTEAQWEYACRAGTTSALNNGKELTDTEYNCTNLDELAWYGGSRRNLNSTRRVKQKSKNNWGLYDMHGNVREWCLDWYAYHYPNTDVDPKGAISGSVRVIRGGGWNNFSIQCRSTYRSNGANILHMENTGFRIALVATVVGSTITGNSVQPASRNGSVSMPQISNIQVIEYETIILPSGVELKLVKIKAGSFVMGSPENEAGRSNEERQHQVRLTTDYWLGETEVTQAQYAAIMGTNPSASSQGGDYPVENVSWDDAMDFCKKLNQHERAAGRLLPGYEYTLPTEAQWEYACRAGTTSALNNGKELTDTVYNCTNLDEVAWYGGSRRNLNSTQRVKQKNKNNWGLYDMQGNVWEWCRDIYGEYPYYMTIDPKGATMGNERVNRGGGWYSNASSCRSASRDSNDASSRINNLGFRVALVAVDSSASASSRAAAPKESETKVTANPSATESAGKGIEYKTIKLPGDVDLKMVKVEKGSFQMGSNDGNSYGKPVHKVTLTQDFWLGETELTQSQYEAVMGNNPSYFKKGGNYPVECVSWDDAMEFCWKLTERERRAGRLKEGYEYSLPTEAQWEYAARSGGKSKGYKYSGGDKIDEVGWYGSNSNNATHPIRQKKPNELGLYDMSGNVWEWCRDSCEWKNGVVTDTYRDGVVDPWCRSGSRRVDRGGGWFNQAELCRSTFRSSYDPSFRNDNLGFRLALVPVQ